MLLGKINTQLILTFLGFQALLSQPIFKGLGWPSHHCHAKSGLQTHLMVTTRVALKIGNFYKIVEMNTIIPGLV